MDPELSHLDDIYHAHWRVKIIKHLMEAHRASPWKGSVTWRLQEADYLQQLASADDQLVLSRRKLADFHQRQEATLSNAGG
jgi:hypothetical protein